MINYIGCITLVFAGTNVIADEESWQDALSINGYYTLDLTYSDSDIPVITNGSIVRHLEEDEFTLENSVLGLQLQYEITDSTRVFLQGTALNDRDDEADLVLDWAYLSFDAGNDYTLRLGQFLIPLLQGTELKNVGYSRLWVRPLVPGSGAGGFKNYAGVELIKRIPLSDSNLNLQFSLGVPDHVLDFVEGKTVGLVAATYETDDYWIRTALLHTDYEVLTRQGDSIDDDAQALMASIEAEVQIQNFIINAGYSDTDADVTPDDTLAYLSLGYQIGDFTPYILGKISKQDFTESAAPEPPGGGAPPPGSPPPGPPPPGSPPPGPPPEDPAPPGFGPGSENDVERNSLAIGLRYDIGENYAIKSQWEYIDNDDRLPASQGSTSRRANVFSILLEGIF